MTKTILITSGEIKSNGHQDEKIDAFVCTKYSTQSRTSPKSTLLSHDTHSSFLYLKVSLLTVVSFSLMWRNKSQNWTRLRVDSCYSTSVNFPMQSNIPQVLWLKSAKQKITKWI